MPTLGEDKFLAFYDQYVTKIYRYIYFRVGSEFLAQDLTSEAFLKYWRHISNNENTLDNPRAFLYQIARNLLADFYRQKDKAPISLEEITDKKIADKDLSPQEQTEQALQIDEVKKALTSLSEDYQEIIIWRYLDELEIKEMSQILEKSEGAVRVLISRALSDLKQILAKSE
jgi:RNA polymerase sigma-70 factor (ECF subfamily)